MNKLKLFTVYDLKAETHSPPFTALTSAEAIRMFETSVKDENTKFHQFPDDFELKSIGTFSIDSGLVMSSLSDVHHLATASDFFNSSSTASN